MRLPLLAALLFACAGDRTDDDDDDGGEDDTADSALGDIQSPIPCPGETEALTWTQEQVQAELGWIDELNAIREAGGSCENVAFDPQSPVEPNDALMWTARCMARKMSTTGDTSWEFEDGTTVGELADEMGYLGGISSYDLRRGSGDGSDALEAWLASRESCYLLFGDGWRVGFALSGEGSGAVVTRLDGF